MAALIKIVNTEDFNSTKPAFETDDERDSGVETSDHFDFRGSTYSKQTIKGSASCNELDKKHNKKRVKSFAKTRRGSFWNLFRRKEQFSWNVPEIRKSNEVEDGDRKIEIHETTSEDKKNIDVICNVDTEEAVGSTQDKLNELRQNDAGKSNHFEFKAESIVSRKLDLSIPESISKTSDLGDSLPSSPISTISSSTSLFIPGLIGLSNLGNTCYINSVFQCLSHIDLFSTYFATDTFQKDISLKQNVRKFKFQTDLLLTSHIAELVKALWQNDSAESAKLCHDLNSVIRKLEGQYNTCEQQDAHEFLMWFINKMHEELMKVPRKRLKDLKFCKKKKASNDEDSAVIAFASYTEYNQSYIQGLFLSQYRSSIKCQQCKKLSSTFDPYTCLSLPIPQRQSTAVFVTFRPSKLSQSPRKCALLIDRSCDVVELKRVMCDKLNIENVLLVEVGKNKDLQILTESIPVGLLSQYEDRVYGMEIRNCSNSNAGKYEKELVLIIDHVEMNGKNLKRFELPVAMNAPMNVSFKNLQSMIRNNLNPSTKKKLTEMLQNQPTKLGLRIVNTRDAGKRYVNSTLECPLLSETVSRAIEKVNDVNYLHLVAEWDPRLREWYMNESNFPVILEDESCHQLQHSSHGDSVQLQQCLNLQTQEENISLDDVWKCGICNTEQRGISKKLTLWSLPDILVLHLKRFDQINEFNGKISTLVDFPLTGLDMSGHVTKTSTRASKYRKESVRMNYQPPPQSSRECIYDLVAVCNHVGSHLNSGHYTASCLNAADQHWYGFDDRSVRQIPQEEVVTAGAYLLFYQRRDLSTRVPEGINVSVRNTRDYPQEHWAYKMMKDDNLRLIKKEDHVVY